MIPTRTRAFHHGFGRALLFSGLLHGLAVLLLWLFGGQGSGGSGPQTVLVDNRVSAPKRDFSLVLVEPPPHRAPNPTAIAQTKPANTPVATDSKLIAATVPTPPPTAPVVPVAPYQAAAGAPDAASDQPHEITGSRSGVGGAGTTTSFFRIPADGKRIVYVIDRSASMGAGGRLATAKRELRASLARLPADTRFQVIPYNRYAEPLRLAGRSDLLPATPENKKLAGALLDAVEAEGSTDHLPALRRALSLRPDVIFFLTDADDLRADQVRAVHQLNHDQAIIHAIELDVRNRDRHDMPLHVLAGGNHGVYRAVEVKKDE